MPDSTVMTTDAVGARERAHAWHEWIWRHFGGLDSDLYGDTDFDGHMWSTRAGDVVLTKLEANRHRVIRRPETARRSETNYLKIVAPWQGCAVVEQHGRQARVRPGSWTLYDTTDTYEIANPERVEHLIVMVPKEPLAEKGLVLPPLMARQVGGSCGISRVALETMRNTYQELPSMSEAAARGAGELIVELVRLSLLELAGRSNATTQMEAFRDRIRQYVGLHLRDPALTPERLAQALNCSKRHLYNAFAGENDTPARYILRRRLQACMRELSDPAHARRTITDIALGWGFASNAHFSRIFREHTGLSPSDYRAAALANVSAPSTH